MAEILSVILSVANVVVIVVAGIVLKPYVTGYSQKKGEARAIREDLDTILEQQRKTTAAQEEIKAAISRAMSIDQRKRELQLDVLGRANRFLAHSVTPRDGEPIDQKELDALYQEGMQIATLSRAVFSGPTANALAEARRAVEHFAKNYADLRAADEAAQRMHAAIGAIVAEIIGERPS